MSAPQSSNRTEHAAGGDAGRDVHGVRILRDIRIPAPGAAADLSATLSADLYLPAGTDPVPALVSVLPYRKDAFAGIGHAETLHFFAAHGYAALLVDFRGTGSSDGPARPPFDPAEADDGVAAIEWAARQPWCTGAVGMWGHSYGAAVTLRTAARSPGPLKAIIPVMGFADPERDFIHPSGAHGCLASLGVWGLGTLLNHLLPPLHAHHTAAEQRRWRHRLENAEPYLLDLYRHPPGHAEWRARTIDLAAVTAPAFCVAGWRDLFCEGSLRSFERIEAPKKLLVGPWTHTMPHDSPFDPADFRTLALRWWDRWLTGTDNGIEREPRVTLHLQGARPRWRQYASWPPPGRTTTLAAAVGATLVPAGRRTPWTAGDGVITSARVDPAVGSCSGLWSIPAGGIGLPLDQHDDDMNSLTVTGPPVEKPLLLIGRPKVTVSLAPGAAPSRLVVKLTDVDPRGRSILISGGVLAGDEEQPADAGIAHEPTDRHVVLDPTAYELPAGHRLRVAAADGGFPRLWPTCGTAPDETWHLTGLRLDLPAVNSAEGEPAAVPVVTQPHDHLGLQVHETPRWTVTRDHVDDGTTVTMGGRLTAHTPQRAHLLETETEISATVRGAAPQAAHLHGTSTATAHLDSGETVITHAELRLTRSAATATGHVSIDGVTVDSRRWHATSANGPASADGAGAESGTVST